MATARTTALTEVAALQEALDIVVDIEMQEQEDDVDAEHENYSHHPSTSKEATPSTAESRETSGGVRAATRETKQPKDITTAVKKIEAKVV